MSSKIDSWLPLYVADYRADTTRLTTEQHGAYLLIIMDYWRNGPPPDDDGVLAQISGLPIDRWKRHRPTIQRFFVLRDGVWTQKRIEQELAKAQRNNAQKSEAGRVSARKRWGNGDGNGEPNGDDNGKVTGVTTDAITAPITADVTAGLRQNAPSPTPTPLPTPKALAAPQPLPSPSPPPAPSARARKRAALPKTPLPDGFTASERVARWADEKGFRDVDRHLESFVGKCRAKGYTYVDWDEAFMSAIRDDWAGIRKTNGSGARVSNDEAARQAERALFGPGAERDITP